MLGVVGPPELSVWAPRDYCICHAMQLNFVPMTFVDLDHLCVQLGAAGPDIATLSLCILPCVA